MKKLFYIFCFFFCQILLAQISDFNNLCVNNTNIQFSSNYFTQKFKTPGGCPREDNNSYKSINYYKITSGGSFEFSMNATQPVNFHVWVLSESEINNFFESTESKFPAVRSSYQSVALSNIGLFSSSVDECEFYNYNNNRADGKLKPIDVATGQYVVIGVISERINTTFSITPGGTAIVCENEPIKSNLTLNLNKCFNDFYTYPEVESFVKNKSSLNNVSLYYDDSLQSQIQTDKLFGNDHPVIYAVAKDNNGIPRFIYEINFVFIPNYQFDFKSTFDKYFECSNEFIIPNETELLNRLFDQTSSENSIYSISVNGILKNFGDKIILQNNEEIDLKVKVKYGGSCPIISEEKIIKIKQEKNNLTGPYDIAICDNIYQVDFNEIFNKISIDQNQFDLYVKFNGNQISNGTSLPISNQLDLKIYIKSKTGGFCESNEVDFLVKKSNPLPIKDASVNVCLEELDNNYIQQKIAEVENGISSQLASNLNFYFNNQLIQRNEIKTIIETNLIGVIVIESLEGCRTTKQLKFDIKTGFQWNNPITSLQKNCLNINESGIFTKQEIENHLKSVFNNQNLVFEGINDETVPSNSTKNIQFKVKEISGCYSNVLNLDLIVTNVPNFASKEDSNKYCEGDEILFNNVYLKRIFGNEIENYSVQINGNDLDWNSPFVERLNFGSSKSKIFVINVKNNNSNCIKTIQLTINKKDIFTPLNNNNMNPIPIIYCSNDDENLILDQINKILFEINNETIGYISTLTSVQILEKYKANRSIVEVEFKNPNYCNSLFYKFDLEEIQSPKINIPNFGEVCNEGTINFDLNLIKDFQLYDFQLLNAQNQLQYSVNELYQLKSGNYTLRVNYKGSTCFTEYKFEIKSAPVPIIEKITINNNQIVVQAKGEGELEYALFEEYGREIIKWQKSNTLILPPNKRLKNAYLQVRLNNCGINTRNYITTLDIQDVYTPNGDMYNNKWATGLGDDKNEYRIQIFDRYGINVYQNEGVGVLKWDGKKNGVNVATDTYYYMIKPLNSTSDLQVQYTGSILVKHK